MAEYNGKTGVWRTVGGRRIFIADGEDLANAMKKSGKFKLKNNKIDKRYNTNEIDKEVSMMSWKDLEETYNSLEKNDNSYEARAIRREYNQRQANAEKFHQTTQSIINNSSKLDDDSFTMTNGNREVTVSRDDSGKWVDSDGNKYMGYLSKSDVKSYFKGNWKEAKTSELSKDFRKQMANADTWEDIHKAIDNIDNDYIKGYLTRSAQELEENENGPWKSASYLSKEYNFYKKEYERDKDTASRFEKYEKELKKRGFNDRDIQYAKYLSKNENIKSIEKLTNEINANYKYGSDEANKYYDRLFGKNRNESALDSSLNALNKIDNIAGNDEKLQRLGREIGASNFQKYNKAWEEYKKEHPNSKINLYTFIKMNYNS